MRPIIVVAGAILAMALPAIAEEKAPPPKHDPLSGADARLTDKELRGIGIGRQWVNNRDLPARGENGSVVFVFGATLPTIVCAPLYVCDLSLQEGETINDIHIGDGVRWQVTPSTSGSAEKATTHVIVKPADIGLITNLLITTNRRIYTIKLISRREEWMPHASFHYPDDVRAQWTLYRTELDRQREAAAAIEPATDTAHADFAYTLSGDEPPWRPVRVYASGAKTYIQFPQGVAHGDLPALVALMSDGGLFSEPTKQLVNYRFVGGRFVVDKILDRAVLISGVGAEQITVTMERQGQE